MIADMCSSLRKSGIGCLEMRVTSGHHAKSLPFGHDPDTHLGVVALLIRAGGILHVRHIPALLVATCLLEVKSAP